MIAPSWGGTPTKGDEDVRWGQSRGGSRGRGGVVTIGTVIGLAVATGLTVLGVGSADHALANYDASAWLWSSSRGEVARVNGVTGRVDTRYKVTDAQGHQIQISQTDRYLIMRDLNTGKVSALDLSTLQVAATTQTTAGLGVSVALGGDAAFIVDAVQGVVRQLDPTSLAPIGEALRFPPGLAGGVFDNDGLLWLLVPGEGTVAAVRPAPAHRSGSSGGPRVVRTLPIADRNHDLSLSVLDSGVAVLDQTAAVLMTVHGDRTRRIGLGLTGSGSLPERTVGSVVPVTAVDDRRVYVVTGDRVRDFTVPGASPKLRPAVAFAGRLYCADDATGVVYVLDLDGRLLSTIKVPHANGPLDLQVREQRLFINAPNGSTARVVDVQGRVKVVDKYPNNVLGGDPPPQPPAPPPSKPRVGPPGAPASVVASAGNARARITWGAAPANGFPVLRYVVEGAGRSVQVGAGQRSLDVTGLTNGQQYRFSVYAVNAKGAGPKRTSNPVIPTADVPEPPTSVTATARPDGTVLVTWPAANGQGHKVPSYQVSAVTSGGQAPIGNATTTSLTIPAGRLTYGTQYAFTVTAINDKGAASKPSPLSASVVPYTVPGQPKNIGATTVGSQRGTIQVSWDPAVDNGRTITKYVVKANNTTTDVASGTGVTLTGLADGATVSVQVTAVNAAGAGPAATATARTVSAPAVTLTAPGAPGYNSLSIPFTVNAGGATNPKCTISVNGGAPATIGCSGYTLGGVWPATTYRYTVTVTNPAGSASASGAQTTLTMYATVICPNNYNGYCDTGIWAYRTPSQSGTAVNPSLPVGTQFQPQCWTSGGTVDARPWGGKNSSTWLRVNRGGTAYFPWAWVRLDGGDNPKSLPPC